MAGSNAEERLREKAVDELRRVWPGARVVHELMMEQGGNRLDLAAITGDHLAIVEIKSERDVFDRLRAQLRSALPVARTVWLVIAAKHRTRVELMQEPTLPGSKKWIEREVRGRKYTQQVSEPNPDYIEELRHCWIFVEDGDGLQRLHQPYHRYDDLDPRALLWMLHAAELQAITSLGSRATRKTMQRHALEHLTGRQIRRAVYGALRTRTFPRADAPIEQSEAA